MREKGAGPRGQVGGYAEGRAAHPRGRASAFGPKERETPQRARTHIQIGQGFVDHAEVSQVVLLGRVILVGPQELPQ